MGYFDIIEGFQQAGPILFLMVILTGYLALRIVAKKILKGCKTKTSRYEKKVRFLIIKEIIFLSLMIMTVLIIVNEYGFFFREFQLQKVVAVLWLFLIIWMSFSILITTNSFRWTRKWAKAEQIATNDHNLDELKRVYKNQIASGSLTKSNKFKIDYILMRQEFIRPVVVPMLTPTQLRQDFDFFWIYMSLTKTTIDQNIYTKSWFSLYSNNKDFYLFNYFYIRQNIFHFISSYFTNTYICFYEISK